MITGAAQAEAALLLIDAAEGVREQTRRHGYLLHLLGVRQVAVVVNKMDRVGYDATRFREIETEITDYLRASGYARRRSSRSRRAMATTSPSTPTRSMVPADRARGAGPALAGTDRAGAAAADAGAGRLQVRRAPDHRRPHRERPDRGRRRDRGAAVRRQDAGEIDRSLAGGQARPIPHDATAGQSIGITLDDALFVERGNLVSRGDAPAKTGNRLRARVFWLHSSALEAGARIGVSIGTADAKGVVTAIHHAVDPGHLAPTESQSIGRNHVGRDRDHADRPIACDPYDVQSRPPAVSSWNTTAASPAAVLCWRSAAAQPQRPRPPSNRAAQLIWPSSKPGPLVSPRRWPGFLPFSALPGCGRNARARSPSPPASGQRTKPSCIGSARCKPTSTW